MLEGLFGASGVNAYMVFRRVVEGFEIFWNP
jgi:hypothetical protein